MEITQEQMKVIGSTIRSVAKAGAERYFKTEKNSNQRAAFVAVALDDEVMIALLDAGIPMDMVLNDIDSMGVIVEEMKAAGFDTGTEKEEEVA